MKHERKCYNVFFATGPQTTVKEMEKTCISHNGLLIDTKTESENKIAVQLLHSLPSPYMVRGIIGLNDRKSEGSYRWSDGTKLTDTWTNWFEGQPDNKYVGWLYDTEDCVLLRHDGKWEDINCNSDFLYSCITLCQKSITVPGNCPIDWIEYGLKCYGGFPPNGELNDVKEMEKEHCITRNGMLMNPKTEEETRIALDVVNYVLSNGQYNGIIGLRDSETEGKFRWRDGQYLTDTWANWDAGQPDDMFNPSALSFQSFVNLGEDCVEMDAKGKWSDCVCQGNKLYSRITLCEQPVKEYYETAVTTVSTATEPSVSTRAAKQESPKNLQRKRLVASRVKNNFYVSGIQPVVDKRVLNAIMCSRVCGGKSRYFNFNEKTNRCRGFNHHGQLPGKADSSWELWAFNWID